MSATSRLPSMRAGAASVGSGLQPARTGPTLRRMREEEFQATVLVGRGSADIAWREPHDRLLARCRARWPAHRIRLAFCERMAPDVIEVLDELAIDLCDRIRLVALDLPPGSESDRLLARALHEASHRWPELVIERRDRSIADTNAALAAAAPDPCCA